MVDAGDLKSSGETRAGSSPVTSIFLSLGFFMSSESIPLFKNVSMSADNAEDMIDAFILEKHRRIFICSSFDDELAKVVIKKIWYLATINKELPIVIVINSGGGSVTAGLAIWDQLAGCGCQIITVVTGLAASMGAVLMLAGSPGKRFANRNARIMVHQPAIHGYVEGQTTDLEIQADEIWKTRKHLVKLMYERTGIDHKTLDEMIDRDKWLTAEEALELNLIDEIVDGVPEYVSA